MNSDVQVPDGILYVQHGKGFRVLKLLIAPDKPLSSAT